jgi:HD-like signal output (HDOD) protein
LQGIRQLQSNPQVSAAQVSAEVLADPMLTLKLMRLANANKRGEFAQRITTAEHAVMMLGLDATFGRLGETPVLERSLPPEAAQGLLRCVARACHAAFQARAWALQRLDTSPEEVYVAVLLCHLGEMGLWVLEPERMLHLEKAALRQGWDEAEARTLGCSLETLSGVLANRYHLPPLVTSALQAELPDNQVRPRLVKLAVRLARDCWWGWHDASLTADLERIAEVRRLPLDEVVAQVHCTAVEFARRRTFAGVYPPARWLPMLPGTWPEEAPDVAASPMPQPDAPQDFTDGAAPRRAASLTLHDVVTQAARGMREGIGLKRVVFALLSRDRTTLEAKYMLGVEEGAPLRAFRFGMASRHLFSILMAKPQAIWMTEANRQKYATYLDAEITRITSGHEFFAMSLGVHGRMVGLFYADGDGAALTPAGYERFRQLCMQAATRMAHLAKPARS